MLARLSITTIRLLGAAGAAAACGSAPVEHGKAAQPPPNTASVQPASCAAHERLFPPDMSFWRGRQRCGCWQGKLRCRDPSRPKCFLNGLWYSKYWKLERGQGTASHSRCTCKGFAWDCEKISNVFRVDVFRGPLNLRFPLGEAELSAKQEREIDEWARETIDEPEGALAMVGVVNADEGEQAAALARKRAEVVRDAFVQRGVPPQRVMVGDVKPGRVSAVILQPVLDPPE